jgi:phosphoribosylanthranilate isomerase
MTWVKLCGMRRRDDVLAAVEAGADAIGFVSYEGSKRYVPLADVGPLAAGVGIERYLVTVDLPADTVVGAALEAGLSGVQPHGENAAEVAAAAGDAGLSVLYPVAVDGAIDLGAVPDGVMPILDSGGTGVHGGSGVAFDWSLAGRLGRDVVIAGGLGPDNVADAVAMARPWGVDVASGIESAPGVKDPALMRRFVEALR